MIEIQKIKLRDLLSFFNSDFYQKLENKPISKTRVLSYVNNPRANEDDIVLYMAFLDKRLVGYRTILSDSIYLNNKKINFGWFSGNWVDPTFRRKGISTKLFQKVLKDWNEKLMFSNYAIASKLLYDKSNFFKNFYKFKGTRFYVRFSLSHILPKKHLFFLKTKPFILCIDSLFNLIIDFSNLLKNKKKVNFNVIENEDINDQIKAIVEDKKNLFKRNILEFNWIQNYPWVLTDKQTKIDAKSYFFSYYSKDFSSKFYSFYNDDKNLVAYFLLTIKDGNLKLPYCFYKKESVQKIVNFLHHIVMCKKVNTITIYDKLLEKKIQEKFSYILKKNFSHDFYCTKDLYQSLRSVKDFSLQTGDGDSVFT